MASSEDLCLADFHEQLPGVVRLLQSESLKLGGDSAFMAFCAEVLELLRRRDVTPSTLLWLARYVVLARFRKKMSSTKGIDGIILVDEQVHLSRVPPSSPSSPSSRHVQAGCQGQLSSSSSNSPRSGLA